VPLALKDVLLLAHAACGVTGSMAALWVFVEALNARPSNTRRIEIAALIAAFAIAATWICGGYWYVRFYAPEKILILGGRWPSAHDLFMDIKEHLFFITAILAFLLPIATREKLHSSAPARALVLSVAALVVITGFALEGAGAVISHGAKIALLDSASRGTR